jgi:hypothetical protein
MKWSIILVAVAALLSGCGGAYVTPGDPASFRALGIAPQPGRTDPAIASTLSRQPATTFPATIAAIRVQGSNYRSHTAYGYGRGSTTIVTNRDVERDEDFQRLARLPMVRAVVPVNRLVMPDKVDSELDLRQAAAAIQADLTLLYTFDTKFHTETTIPALGVLTLGLFPSEQARVTSTASAALLDTRTGYVYALAEATDQQNQIANAWTSDSAVDQSRRRAERKAFEDLLMHLENAWKPVVERHAAGPRPAPIQVQPYPPTPYSPGYRPAWPGTYPAHAQDGLPSPQGVLYRTR